MATARGKEGIRCFPQRRIARLPVPVLSSGRKENWVLGVKSIDVGKTTLLTSRSPSAPPFTFETGIALAFRYEGIGWDRGRRSRSTVTTTFSNCVSAVLRLASRPRWAKPSPSHERGSSIAATRQPSEWAWLKRPHQSSGSSG